MNYRCDQGGDDVKCFQLNAGTDHFELYSGIRCQASEQNSEASFVQENFDDILVEKG